MNEDSPTPEKLPLIEAGQRLGISRTRMRELIDAGQLTAEWEITPQGRARRVVALADVNRLLEARTQEAQEQTGKGRPIKLPNKPDAPTPP